MEVSDAFYIDNVKFERMLANIHYDRHAKLSDFPILERFISDENSRNLAVERVLKGGNIGKYTAKLLHATCLLCGIEKSVDICARFIFIARDRDELINFVTFALTITPYYPKIMTAAVQRVLSSVSKFTSEMQESDDAAASGATNLNDLTRARFIINLLTLLEWQKTSDARTPEERSVKEEQEDKQDIKYLGICLADLDNGFREELMIWVLAYVEIVGRRNSLCEASVTVIDSFLSLMRAVQPHAQLRLQHPNRLLRQFCALIMGLLKLVNKDEFGTPYDRVDFVYRCYAVTGVFFSYLVGANKNFLISSLFDEAFENSASLFGTPKNVSRLDERMIDFDRFVTAGLLPSFSSGSSSMSSSKSGDKKEYSCLRQLRATSLAARSAASMAHTGMLSARHQKLAELRVGETETLRTLIFVHMIENLCMPKDDGYDLGTYRHLGSVFTDRFCQDGITSCFSWADWKTERELIPRYVETSKQLDAVPFVDDFLMMLAEVGISGVFYALPVVKAQFAAVLIQLENTPLKDDKLSAQNVLRVARLISIFIAADFIPKLLEILFEMICLITNHESCILLTHLWNLIQSIVPESTLDVDSVKAKISSNDFLTRDSAGTEFMSAIVLVVQRNIVELGEFFPLIVNVTGMYSETQGLPSQDGELTEESEWH